MKYRQQSATSQPLNGYTMHADADAHDGPHSLEAEQSVLGGLLLDNTAWDRARGVVSAEHFYRTEHRLIFSAISVLIEAGKPADIITVHEELQRSARSDQCGGMQYLNALAQSVPSASNLRRYAEIVAEHAQRREILAAAERARSLPLPDAIVGIMKALVRHDDGDSSIRVIDMSTIHRVDTPQTWVWDSYVPHGHVTLLSGHGGAGKSTLALLLAACVAMGNPALGRRTERTRVLFVSAEDPASMVLSRLRLICRRLSLPLDELGEWLQVVDLAEGQPVLFTEHRLDGVRQGVTTQTYEEVTAYVRREGFGFVVVDNASDVFDADEISRSMVRGFIRSLRAWARDGGAVMLLGHVDKGTSRAAKAGGAESYSGSTAWHNSVRSRLFLLKTGPRQLELQHQKCNVGPVLAPLQLEWPDDEVMQVVQSGGFVAAIEAKADTRAVLKLLHEFTSRGESVAASPNARNHAVKLMASEPSYPAHLKPAEVFALLRNAQRDRLISIEPYRNGERKARERWALTEQGVALITAPSAPGALGG